MVRSNAQFRRTGFTLIEILVVVAILALLTGLIVFAGSGVLRNQKKQTAQSQLKVIADGIDRYSAVWGPWTNVMAFSPPATSRQVNTEVTTHGFPDFNPRRLFPNGVFTVRPPDFDMVVYEFDWMGNPDLVWEHAHVSNECLAYCLLSDENGGPFLENNQLVNMIVHDDEFYPTRPGVTAGNRATILDPWGNPYRYFWTAKAADTVGTQSQNGRIPVRKYEYNLTNAGGGKAFFADADAKYAEGYVLESAGPDGEFGNQWSANPTANDKAFAQDNVYLIRP